MSDKIQIFQIISFTCFFSLTFSALTFYNVECNSFDKTFCYFEYCHIKAVNRSLKYCSAKVNILKLPITKISIQLALSYRANGWKPFLYNYTYDACKFMKSKHKISFVQHMYKTIEKFSNLNHTCPLNHNLILNNLSTSSTENLWTKILPTPEGQYRANAVWFLDGNPSFEFILYAKIS